MKYLPLLLVALLGCTHARPVPRPQKKILTSLVPPPGFSFAPVANLPYEPANLASYQGADGTTLKILETEEPSAPDAAERMKSQAEGVLRHFERQADPYYGLTKPDSSCVNRADFAAAPQDLGNMLLKPLRYQANRNFQITTCESDDYSLNVNALFLYCKNSGRLYSLRYFFPKKSAAGLHLEGFSCSP